MFEITAIQRTGDCDSAGEVNCILHVLRLESQHSCRLDISRMRPDSN